MFSPYVGKNFRVSPKFQLPVIKVKKSRKIEKNLSKKALAQEGRNYYQIALKKVLPIEKPPEILREAKNI